MKMATCHPQQKQIRTVTVLLYVDVAEAVELPCLHLVLPVVALPYLLLVVLHAVPLAVPLLVLWLLSGHMLRMITMELQQPHRLLLLVVLLMLVTRQTQAMNRSRTGHHQLGTHMQLVADKQLGKFASCLKRTYILKNCILLTKLPQLHTEQFHHWLCQWLSLLKAFMKILSE